MAEASGGRTSASIENIGNPLKSTAAYAARPENFSAVEMTLSLPDFLYLQLQRRNAFRTATTLAGSVPSFAAGPALWSAALLHTSVAREFAGRGFSGEWIRTGKALLCDDSETDSRVEAAICRRLGVRSIVTAPSHYECQIVGLVEVFSPQSFAFDEGDIAILERLAQTVLLTGSQAQLHHRGANPQESGGASGKSSSEPG
jgi:GAF domain-containing protein